MIAEALAVVTNKCRLNRNLWDHRYQCTAKQNGDCAYYEHDSTFSSLCCKYNFNERGQYGDLCYSKEATAASGAGIVEVFKDVSRKAEEPAGDSV